MNSVEVILYFAAVAICGFCFLLLVFCRSYIKRFSVVLGVFVALLCLGFVLQMLIYAPWSYWKHLWMFLAIVHAFAVGPCIWLYAQSIQGCEVPIRKVGVLKLSLFGAGVLLASPLLTLIHHGASWVGPNSTDSKLFWRVYGVMSGGYVLIYFYQALLYFKQCLPYLSRDAAIPVMFRFCGNESTAHTVLRLTMLGFLATLCINVVRVSHCALIGQTTIVSPLLSLIESLIGVFVLLLVFTVMIRSMATVESQAISKESRVKGGRYLRSALDEQMRVRIKAKLETAMNDPDIYTRNNLTLPMLAQIIGEKHHYVSQVVNQDLSTTVLDLVNKARIDRARCLIAENTELPIVDVIEIIGFNSKTTFYTAFAKYVGTTPTQYRRSVRV